MEDDDEFGDLYTDVLRPFTPPAPPPPQLESLRRPIDLNHLQNDDEDDAGNVFEAPTTSIPGLTSSLTLAPARDESAPAASNFRGGAAEGSNLKEEDVTFDIEEEDSGAMIPGLDSNPVRDGDDGTGGGDGDDDWESEEESDDDLQIVLNGPSLLMERGDEDEDDEHVITADGDPNQAMEEQDWGDDPTAAAGLSADGKEAGEGGKAGVGSVPKLSYGNHGYHPFHSQFKYVRPGAEPIPGAATSGPGGLQGQVRPLANMGPAAVRGRGDWRPMVLKNGTSMLKNFHSGFGAWGGNAAGRGFGGGLDFTLPSHKSIFEIDIDSFEEKPWKYPGADPSDFFNFDFNEDSWKDYCKQLEQHRIESTMQSKIRVYESGRTEQEYDPDLPPELAAATGIQEVQTENVNPVKFEVEQSDLPKGSARVRPPLPPGRPIQVETGYGERLPSIDTRPPRMRDSDAIIEIVLQKSLDDDTPAAGDEVSNQPDDDDSKGDIGGTIPESEISAVDTEYHEKYPQSGVDQKRERKIPFQNSVGNNTPDRDVVLPFPPGPVRNGDYVSVHPRGDLSPEYKERKTHERPREKSPNTTPNQNARSKKYRDDTPEDSVNSMDSKHSPLSSPATLKDAAHESSVELRDDVDDQDDITQVNRRSGREKDDSPSNKIAVTDTLEEGVANEQKLNSPLEEDSFDREPDDGDEDSRAARSSDNSRARSGSSRDYAKRRDGPDEEVIQRHSNRTGHSAKRHFDDKEQNFHRRNRDGRQEPDRNRLVTKPREDSYPYREFDSNSVHSHIRADGFERRKERDNPDGSWQRRDDDPYGRRMRAAEETRKRERGGDEMGSRDRGSKVRESDRIEKDEFVHSRKQMDNNGGTHRNHYDKDSVARHRERDDNNLKSRYEHMDDYHGKRKKEEEYPRRDYLDKEETSHGYRENANRWKRERDGQQRLRDNIDDHQSSRQKEEIWLQRERGERGGREREEWPRVKQSYDENIPKRERDEGRGVSRSNHPKVKDDSKGSDKDYQYKETARHGELSKRRERTEDESSHHGGREDVYGRGNQMSNGERRSRQERPRNNDRSVTASEDLKLHEKKQKDFGRRNRDSDGGGGENSSLISSQRNQEDNSGQTNETGSKGFGEQNSQRQASKKLKEDASDEDQQQDSRRGRSKLERWTSHTERDFSFKSKKSTILKIESLEGTKILEEPSKPIETANSLQSLIEERESADLEGKDGEPKPSDDQHLDTAEKLKKRSERFKLPMPSSDKEAPAIRKVESEPLAPTRTATQVDSEVKQERPARKRRWISN